MVKSDSKISSRFVSQNPWHIVHLYFCFIETFFPFRFQFKWRSELGVRIPVWSPEDIRWRFQPIVSDVQVSILFLFLDCKTWMLLPLGHKFKMSRWDRIKPSFAMVTLMKKLLSDGAGFHNILCYCCEVFLSTIHRILDLQCFSIYRGVTIDLKSKVLRLF